MNLRFALLGFVALLSLNAFAMDGSSGCGPGWYLFKEDSIVSSALRATTNGISGLTTTIGMTFGTSNCTKHKLVKTEKESLYFVANNHYELKRDISKGDGEYLAAFATTMGCPASAQGRLNQSLKAQFTNVYPVSSAKPEDILLEVYKTILSDQDLTNQCSLGAA